MPLWTPGVRPEPQLLVLPKAAVSLDEAHGAIDLWEFPDLGGEQAASLLAQPPAFTLLAPYEINSPEDEHRLANTARFDPLFQMQQRTAFDLLPIG